MAGRAMWTIGRARVVGMLMRMRLRWTCQQIGTRRAMRPGQGKLNVAALLDGNNGNNANKTGFMGRGVGKNNNKGAKRVCASAVRIGWEHYMRTLCESVMEIGPAARPRQLNEALSG